MQSTKQRDASPKRSKHEQREVLLLPESSESDDAPDGEAPDSEAPDDARARRAAQWLAPTYADCEHHLALVPLASAERWTGRRSEAAARALLRQQHAELRCLCGAALFRDAQLSVYCESAHEIPRAAGFPADRHWCTPSGADVNRGQEQCGQQALAQYWYGRSAVLVLRNSMRHYLWNYHPREPLDAERVVWRDEPQRYVRAALHYDWHYLQYVSDHAPTWREEVRLACRVLLHEQQLGPGLLLMAARLALVEPACADALCALIEERDRVHDAAQELPQLIALHRQALALEQQAALLADEIARLQDSRAAEQRVGKLSRKILRCVLDGLAAAGVACQARLDRHHAAHVEHERTTRALAHLAALRELGAAAVALEPLREAAARCEAARAALAPDLLAAAALADLERWARLAAMWAGGVAALPEHTIDAPVVLGAPVARDEGDQCDNRPAPAQLQAWIAANNVCCQALLRSAEACDWIQEHLLAVRHGRYMINRYGHCSLGASKCDQCQKCVLLANVYRSSITPIA